MTHYIEVTVDPEGDPDSPYPWDRWVIDTIECDVPGGCGGWQECREDHAGYDPDGEDSPAFDTLEDVVIHGVSHAWENSTWTIPFEGCSVAEWADLCDLWDGIDGPGRYEVDADWSETECYLSVVGPAEEGK